MPLEQLQSRMEVLNKAITAADAEFNEAHRHHLFKRGLLEKTRQYVGGEITKRTKPDA